MKRVFMLVAPLSIATGLVVLSPSLNSPRTIAKAGAAGLDVRSMEAVDRGDMPSFDDRYQRHIGVLDVLRPYR